MSNRRKFAPTLFVSLFVAFMGFAASSNMASNPRFATFRSIDVVRLIAGGMCFGVALVGLVMFFIGRRSS